MSEKRKIFSERFSPERIKPVSVKKYGKYIDEFMFSPEMRSYLKSTELEGFNFAELIAFSPVPVERKLEAFRSLAKEAGLNKDFGLQQEYVEQSQCFEKALSFLSEDGVFVIEPACYSDYTHDADGYFDSVLADLNDVKDYIRDFYIKCELDRDDLWWFDVSKWIKNNEGKYIEACDYIFVRDEIWYSDICDDPGSIQYNFYWSDNLNLPVPFKPGDILQSNRFPFGPKVKYLILEIGDNSDCCCVQALFRGEGGLWDTGALKHGHVGYSHNIQGSPLYTATAYNSIEDEDDRILSRVKDYIGGDEVKGKKLWDAMFDKHNKVYSERGQERMTGMTNEELLELIKE